METNNSHNEEEIQEASEGRGCETFMLFVKHKGLLPAQVKGKPVIMKKWKSVADGCDLFLSSAQSVREEARMLLPPLGDWEVGRMEVPHVRTGRNVSTKRPRTRRGRVPTRGRTGLRSRQARPST